MYNALKDSQITIDLASYSLNEDEVEKLFSKVIYENLELFYVSHSYDYNYYKNGIIQSFIPSYTMSGITLTVAKHTYKNKLDEIIGSMNSSWSNLEKIIYINDYFTTHFIYSLDYNNAYSIFAENAGNCQAYTLAFMAVMKELSIHVSYVISESMDHCWLLVYVNDAWYHLDVTWDDPATDMPGRSFHMNLLLSDTGIKATEHSDWTSDYICTSKKYDKYFWKDVYAPIVYNDGVWYYISSTDFTLYSYNFTDNKSTSLLKIDSKWIDMANAYIWEGCLSGLGSYNDILYYNTPNEISI
jgi:hypothetical protein